MLRVRVPRPIGLRAVAGALAGAAALVADPAAGMTTAWKRGTRPTAVANERAVLAYDRATRLEHLIVEATLSDVGDGTQLVVTTPGLPTILSAQRGAFDHVAEIEGDGAAAPALAPEPAPPAARSFRLDERGALSRFVADAGLETAPGFDAWLGALAAGTVVTLVAVPSGASGSTTVTFRLAYRTDEPHYPFSAPLLAGRAWPPLALVLLGETPMVPNPSAGRLASLLPTRDVELSGAAIGRLPETLRTSLGFDRPPSTLWVGRYDVPPSDRTRVGDLTFAVSPHRRADSAFHLLGPPFGSAAPSAAQPSAAPSAAVEPRGSPDRPESLLPRKRRTQWGPSTTGGVGFLVIAAIALGYWFYKRKLS